MVTSSSKPVGGGSQKLRQVLESIANRQINRTVVEFLYGEVVGPGRIRLDVDGYELNAVEGDFIVLNKVLLNTGDRIIAVPVGGKRGTVLVLGRWQANAIPGIRDEKPIFLVGESPGVTTPHGVGPPALKTDVASLGRIQLSRGWFHPHSRIRAVGFAQDNRAPDPETIMRIQCVDDINGLIADDILAGSGPFSVNIPWSDITDNDLNHVVIQASYTNSHADDMTVTNCVLLIGNP
jgi:hypothetical protein